MFNEFASSGQSQPLQHTRRSVLKGAAAVGLGSGLAGCAHFGGPGPAAVADAGARLKPIRVTPDQLIDVKCCLRPLRAAGPNLGTEMIGDTLVVHNYGHGGSGWSLSWGSAEVAVGKALSVLPSELAVVGCGIVGLTTAVVAQRAGLKVTIYAKDIIQRTRSFRASGAYTPDARVSLAGPAGPAFGDQWEQMARLSWKAFRTMLGLQGRPVEFVDQYALSDTPFAAPRPMVADPAIQGAWEAGGLPKQNSEFGRYSERLRDIVPQAVPLEARDNPFPLPYVARRSSMHFNFTSYAQTLLTEFFARGGQIVMRDFNDPSQYGQLKEKVVINATGLAARDLWRDKTIIPVRGQTGWLVPQPDAYYSVNYKGVSLTSKADGIVVMNNPAGLGNMYGVGDTLEWPDRAPILEGLKTLEPLMAAMSGRGA